MVICQKRSSLRLITAYFVGTRVYVEASHDHYGGNLEGLCGNFDGNSENDFQAPNGGPISDTVNEFAMAYKVDGTCPDSDNDAPEEPCVVGLHHHLF